MRIIYCVLSGVAVALLIFALVPGGGSASGLSLFLMILDLALFAGALTFNITSNEERTAEFYCYLYFLLFFLIPGYIHTSTGRYPFYGMIYDDAYVMGAAGCVLVFTIFFFIGYSLANNYESRSRRGSFRPNASMGYELALIYAAVSIVVAVGFGISKFTASRGDVDLLMPEATPAGIILITVPRILSFVAFLICLAELKNRLSWTGIFILLPVSAVFAVVNSPIAIPRFELFAYIIIIITVFFKLTKRNKIILLTGFVVGQFTIFPAVSLLSRGDIRDLFSTPLTEFFIANGDFDGFQSTINVVRFAEEGGYRLGVNLLSALLFFLPRVFWPGKSIGTGGEAAAFNGYDFINISAPLPSEFFVDFGFVGVVVGATLFGALLAKVDGRIRAYRTSPDKLQLFGPASIIGYLFIILRGSLVGVMGPLTLTYSVIWLSAKLIEFRRRLVVAHSYSRSGLSARRRLSRGR